MVKVKKAARQAQELELMNAHVALQTGQFENAKTFLNKIKLEELAEQLLGRYYATLGETEVELREFDSAVADLKQALELLENNPKATILEIERVRNWLGLAYYRQGRHFLAIECHQRCLQMILDRRVSDRRFKMKIYYNLANEYYNTGNTQQALHLYREAIAIAEKGEDTRDLAGMYWGIGLVYRALDNLALAKLYLDKSANLYEAIPDLHLAVTVKGILGQSLIEREEFEEAEQILKSALEIALRLNDNYPLQITYINLAYLYYTQKRLEEAEQNAVEGVARARSSGEKTVLGQALAQLAEIKIARQMPEEGIKLFDEAIFRLEETDAIDQLARIHFRYASALAEIGKLAEATRYYRKAYEYQKRGKMG